ncbi:MAG TPA: hypothetical protein VJ981_03240 [Gammaproteobacteria bacterium]|nr:hypothetical protein [Gammaproteobacteria bacterium]
MLLKDLIKSLFKQGLGELLVLHVMTKTVYLGHIAYEKGRLVIKDKGYLTGVKSTQLLPCWEEGILGVVCSSEGMEWDSITFCGRGQCNIPVDLSSTRQGAFMMAQNQNGENLLDFVGSVYRGYQLMLDNHYLPVVLLNQINTKSGETGLVVSDLRIAPIDLSIIRNVNNAVRESVERRTLLEVEDLEVGSGDFEKLFGKYLPGN